MSLTSKWLVGYKDYIRIPTRSINQPVFHGISAKGFDHCSTGLQTIQNASKESYVLVWLSFRVLKGPGVSNGRGCSWGTLRIPFGKIGQP